MFKELSFGLLEFAHEAFDADAVDKSETEAKRNPRCGTQAEREQQEPCLSLHFR